jgi:hypothetical protein
VFRTAVFGIIAYLADTKGVPLQFDEVYRLPWYETHPKVM